MAFVNNSYITGTISGTGATDSFELNMPSLGMGRVALDLSLSGMNGHVVAVERSFDSGNTWKEIAEYATDKERAIEQGSIICHYRLNCKTFGTGSVTFWLGKVHTSDQ